MVIPEWRHRRCCLHHKSSHIVAALWKLKIYFLFTLFCLRDSLFLIKFYDHLENSKLSAPYSWRSVCASQWAAGSEGLQSFEGQSASALRTWEPANTLPKVSIALTVQPDPLLLNSAGLKRTIFKNVKKYEFKIQKLVPMFPTSSKVPLRQVIFQSH